MPFVITYIADDASLRTVKSEDIPAKIVRVLTAQIELLEKVDDEVLTKTITIPSELNEEDVMKINMYDALRAAGVDNWEGWDNAVEIYNADNADVEDAPTAEAA